MPSPDFRLYHSNALDVLARLLAHAVREPAPGQSLLAPDVVLIPQAAMRRWLQATLAAEHGIAANIDFRTPGEFVRGVLDANIPGGSEDLDAAGLHWPLYAALTDREWMSNPALSLLAAHVAGPDPLRAWSLAGELAATFEKYQAWRRDWLLRWEAGADADDPQALLWRRIARGRAHRARRIQQFLDRFEADDAPLPAGVPARVFAFATLNVSPDVLRVMACAARSGPLHFYVHSPTRAYWGDLQRMRAGKPIADDQPLLQAWGAAGRDFMAVIGGYEVVHASAEIPAHVDPLDGGGDLRGSLLRRMQSDLFHRHATPGQPLRTAFDRTDPSVQVHACATRLREVQVLHDQLRALFDDPRFDPPLEPRDIAVLAPDIDPYAPYFEAVFGRRGEGGAIAYALADASPLAGEPLAEVFLQVLALPVSRFGLGETLDLIASPPLAEVTGLDAATLDRLHGWLRAAGARWGLDGAHRARRGAPEDDAYTWTFAIDRLLMGHATGSDETVAGIAPLPVLEGNALDALDRLLRVLRILARASTTLGAASTPDGWRERLLGVLDALLPRPPAQAATQRTLDRLRTAIDAFAADAARAGFDAPVPPEAVRAHFTAVLGEADTRAPLLTGGVSVGRMVPMRLLPFRVVCVLGLDDGAFPRRDPAAGLNRLTAQLGTPERRIGDRSTRDDDRFLMLQLFAAAQDVFYVSYLGIDARDGSTREPSVLVGDLLAAVDAQHDGEARPGAAFVVRHPLQPFAPSAFGAGEEPRRFSYRQAWWPAASLAVHQRTPLPPWFGPEAMPPGEGEARVSLDALRRFLQAPAEAFLRQRLGLRLAEVDAVDDDIEPLLAPGRGLARHAVQRAVFEACLRGDDDASMQRQLRARGLLPSGPLGRGALRTVLGEVAPYADALRAWRGDADAQAVALEVDLDGTVLHGRIADVHPHGIARVRFAPPGGRDAIRNGLDWLLASAAGRGEPLVEFHDLGDAGPGPHVRPCLDPDAARGLLKNLLALRARGLREPLPFGPYAGWKMYTGATMDRGLANAASTWRGRQGGWGEGEGDALRLAVRGRDPFTDEAAQAAFVDASHMIFYALVEGVAHAGTDAAALRAMAAALDMDDAE